MSSEGNIPFKIARADAIEAYSGVEQSLCSIFARLLGARGDKAAVVFFRIGSARSRLIVLGDLLEKTYGRKYDLFFYGKKSNGNAIPGIFTLVGQLDQKRNEIVHWHWPLYFNLPDWTRVTELRPPAEAWERVDKSAPVTLESLRAFSEKSIFVYSCVNMLDLSWSKHAKAAQGMLSPWLQIFEQPVPYPPPHTHPIFQSYEGWKNPPQPSEASAQEERPQDHVPPEDAY